MKAVRAGSLSDVTFHYDAETHCEPIGDHTWRCELSDAWNIGENPNGGYLLAPLQRAMQQASSHADPLSVTTHFLRPGQAGEAVIEVEPIRLGRTISTMRGRLVQDGRTRLEAVGAFTDLESDEAVLEVDQPPPEIPDPDECPPRTVLAQGVELPIMQRVDVRIHPDHVLGGTGREPVICGWIRLADGRPVDSGALSLFADAFPPPLFASIGHTGWVPTIELTVHVRRRPASGWILGRFETTDAAGNRTIEDGRLWDESGALVAVARQVGLVRLDAGS